MDGVRQAPQIRLCQLGLLALSGLSPHLAATVLATHCTHALPMQCCIPAGGMEEYEAVKAAVGALPPSSWVSSETRLLNRPSAPVLLLVWKRP